MTDPVDSRGERLTDERALACFVSRRSGRNPHIISRPRLQRFAILHEAFASTEPIVYETILLKERVAVKLS